MSQFSLNAGHKCNTPLLLFRINEKKKHINYVKLNFPSLDSKVGMDAVCSCYDVTDWPVVAYQWRYFPRKNNYKYHIVVGLPTLLTC